MYKEIWKPINKYEGIYEISNLGRVKSLPRERADKNGFIKGRILKNILIRIGYFHVTLSNTEKEIHAVHRLVASAFLPNPENKITVNHKNGIKTDNKVDNLEWATFAENNRHAFNTGLHVSPRGGKHWKSKLTKSDILFIRANCDSISRKDMAEQFNVNNSHISNIVNRKFWKHI